MEYQREIVECDDVGKFDLTLFGTIALLVCAFFISIVYCIETISIATGVESMLFKTHQLK